VLVKVGRGSAFLALPALIWIVRHPLIGFDLKMLAHFTFVDTDSVQAVDQLFLNSHFSLVLQSPPKVIPCLSYNLLSGTYGIF